jgi:hypothetical protein
MRIPPQELLHLLPPLDLVGDDIEKRRDTDRKKSMEGGDWELGEV